MIHDSFIHFVFGTGVLQATGDPDANLDTASG